MARHRGVTLEDVREIASQLPRSYEVFVYGRVKFRVGQIVWLAFSRDQTEIGFSFPKELRQALVESDPDTYFLPGASDLRFNWACAAPRRAQVRGAARAGRGCLVDRGAEVHRRCLRHLAGAHRRLRLGPGDARWP